MPRFFDEHRLRPEERTVLAMLRTAAPTVSLEFLHDAWAEVTAPRWKHEWAQGLGLTESQAAHPCIARVQGRRCPQAWRRDAGDWEPCLPPPATDHPSVWVWQRKAVCFVSQPYALHEKDLAEMAAYADTTGLELVIRGRAAWHFPGDTLLVMWWNSRLRRAMREAQAQPRVAPEAP